jgi:SEC-C motif-containing protein
MTDCPCGSGQSLEACCHPYISGQSVAPNPEAVMRSRYTAFAIGNIPYLNDTLAADQRHDFNAIETEKWAKESKWLGLEIHGTEGGAEGDDAGTVDFTAHYRFQGKLHAHHEVSTFRREGGRWFYVDGDVGPRPVVQRVAVKIGRNDPCTCGSGKKYKKCCGA